MPVNRYRRSAYRSRRRVPYQRRSTRIGYLHRRRRVFRRRPIRQRAMRKAGNLVRYTAKNNVNLLFYWPSSDDAPALPGKISPVSPTSTIGLSVAKILFGNRQFDRNIRDYQYIKFNYIAVKVTDLAHIPYQTLQQVQIGDQQFVAPLGVSDICGRIPINLNWDLEQDFTFEKGKEGVVDADGFAQHPGTKQLRPTDRKPVSFVYRVPKPWKQFVHTDNVKNSTQIDGKFADFMADVTGIKNIRAPYLFFLSIPNFWSTFFPNDSTTKTVNVKTYCRVNVYLGVTFRGRRLMDDGTCTAGSCSFSEVINGDKTINMTCEEVTVPEQ